VIDEHRLYLADAVRVSAFGAALAEIVQPDDVVLDLGSGTGILGLLACRAGAARVYAIDAGGMAQLAREVVGVNGLKGRVRVVNGFSATVDLPERADLLVTDQIGHFGFEAGIVGYVADARRRLLQPHARLVPSRIDLWLAPVEAADVASAVEFWFGHPAEFDMSPLRELAVNSGYPRALQPDEVLGSPALGGSIDLHVDCRSVALEAETTIARAGTLHGIGGWFVATLSPHVTMSNSPFASDRITRRNVVFPIERPTAVTAGDRVRTRMRILPDDSVVSWTVEVFRREADTAAFRFAHSTLRGMLLAREQIRRTRPDYVPELTPRGLARLSVLTLCDGQRPLAEIEREVYARHATIFRDPAEAAVFVAEVVAGYAV
jgi:protein arginine N-methyltransferase 1